MSKLNKQTLLDIKQLILKELEMFRPQLKNMDLERLKEYYVELRKNEYEQGIPLENIETRKNFHSVPFCLIKIDRLFSMESLKIISNESTKTNRPLIYACTHIGGNDIQRTFEAIKEHAYLFLGDPEGLYKDFSGLLLGLNGVICLETRNKNDRIIAKERAIELLKKGGNLLIYPEGAWNITDNLPCENLYTGTIRMALETNAEIIPIAIEQYGRKFYVNIGKNIDVSLTPGVGINTLNEYLRDTLATLKWRIWEYQKPQKRSKITEKFRNEFKQNIIDKCEYGFTIDDVYATLYKSPNITEPLEGYEFTEKLKQHLKNAKTTVIFDEKHDEKCRERAKQLVKELKRKRSISKAK